MGTYLNCEVLMANQPKPTQPAANRDCFFVGRIWHWRARRFLYAKDYGPKGFPLKNSKS
jgi:hypothetical protein